MTPGARLQAAIEILRDSLASPLPADSVADAYFRRRRYAGSGDRRAILERIFSLLRRRARLGWHLVRAGHQGTPEPRALALADLVVGDGLDGPQAAALFGSSTHAPEALSESERRVADAMTGGVLADPTMPDPVRLEYPAWLDESLRGAFGDKLAVEMGALNARAALDLRVNIAKTTREEARAALAQDGIKTEPTPLSPWGLRVRDAARIGNTHAFKAGLVEAQDEGSQIAALLVGARPSMTIIDLCAGAGGKTLALAASMGEQGRIQGRLIACDTSAERLERMIPRLARAGIDGVRRVVLKDDDFSALAEFSGAADRVLLDVPCSGSGAWRRDPLAKWRLTPETLADLCARQRRILDRAAALVRPGGRLVYVTCSVLPQENEAAVGAFISHDDGFRVVPAGEPWTEAIGVAPPAGDQFLRLSPARNGTDGFFIAVLERVSA